MANLKRTHHQLAKAEKELRKYSRSQKQFQVQFVRKPKNGKFKTTAHIRRGEKSSRYVGHGLRFVSKQGLQAINRPSQNLLIA